ILGAADRGSDLEPAHVTESRGNLLGSSLCFCRCYLSRHGHALVGKTLGRNPAYQLLPDYPSGSGNAGGAHCRVASRACRHVLLPARYHSGGAPPWQANGCGTTLGETMKEFISVWGQEYRNIFADKGVLMLFVVAIFFYSVFYPVPYSNEVL